MIFFCEINILLPMANEPAFTSHCHYGEKNLDSSD